MKVLKRDGREVEFNKEKIENAIIAAFVEVDGDVSEETIAVTKVISASIEALNKDLSVEAIQDIIEKQLRQTRKDVARAYKKYRLDRTKRREAGGQLIKKVKQRINATNVENSNANVDEHSFSGREKEASSDVSKFIALNLDGLSEEAGNAHKEMRVYEHDLEKAIYGIHNCLNLDFGEIFTNGFTTRNGDVRPPTSFSTACQLVAVAFQCQSQVQFGGVGSIHIDYDLAPFVKMSFAKHFIDGMKYLEEDELVTLKNGLSIEDVEYKKYPKAYEYAMDMLEREGQQAAQGLYHNLNTLESRQGSQVPFTSINMGRDTSPEGRLVTKWLLEASIDGIGKYHLTSIFPISIFQYKKGVNANPEDPNYDLKQLALKSLSKRIYPNFCNGDWSQAHETLDDPDTFFSTMGCRTLVGYDRHGLGYTRQGRGNNVPCTMILPKIGIEYGICLGERTEPDLEGFWNEFEETLKLTERMLLERFEIIAKQSPKAAPFMYLNNTIKGARDCDDTVYNAVKHGTLAIGYTGIAEMCVALFGKNHAEDKDVHAFALSVVKRINEFAAEASERNNLNFSCYASPFEGGCRTALMALREQYGIIENVTSHEYLTNSHHVPVWTHVSAHDKLRLEAPFCKYPTGGCITYLEADGMFVKNLQALEDIIDYGMSLDIPYLAINFPIDSCLDCGYQGEMNSECPQCHSNNIQHLARVTGYLTTDVSHFNDGKKAEVAERQKNTVLQDVDFDLYDIEDTDQICLMSKGWSINEHCWC